MGFFTGETDAPAPDFTLTDIDGTEHNLSDYNGSVLLLDFMGTWCGPCQRAVGDLRGLLQAFPDLRILSVSATDSAPQLDDFRTRYGVTWPLAVDTDDVVLRTVDAAGGGRITWPSYALVQEGRIVFFNEGETLPATLAAALDGRTGHAAGLDAGAAGAALWAFALGGAAFASPFLPPHTLARAAPPSPRDRWAFLAVSVAVPVALGLLLAYAGRPLTGRLVNLAPFAAIAGLLAVAWWRVRGEAAQADSKGLDAGGARFAWSLHGNLLYYTLPVWFPLALWGMRSTQPLLLPLGLGAFGAGLAAAAHIAWHTTAGARPGSQEVPGDGGPAAAAHEGQNRAAPAAGWLGAAVLLAGAAWTGVQYLQ